MEKATTRHTQNEGGRGGMAYDAVLDYTLSYSLFFYLAAGGGFTICVNVFWWYSCQ